MNEHAQAEQNLILLTKRSYRQRELEKNLLSKREQEWLDKQYPKYKQWAEHNPRE